VRVVASAAMVAAVVAISEAEAATISDRIVASCTRVLAQAASYQRHEKPSHRAMLLPELNE
jgi:hypothetical protein